MSAESGLAVFRGSNGMWDKYRIEDVATPEGWYRNPELVLDFYNQRRRELLKTAPNAGHKGLKDLERSYDVRIITQNVDNLHERAGSSNIIHLHGELIVWFGEAVPMMDKAAEWASGADIFVVIGTSLNVYPAAGLLAYVKPGVPVYLIDPNEVNDPYRKVTRYIRKGAGEGVKELMGLLAGNGTAR